MGIIRKILPRYIFEQIEKLVYNINKSREKSKGKSAVKIFTHIYNNNYWNSMKSFSGTGSDETQTETIRRVLPTIIKNYYIKTMLDLPCGDYNWMQHVDLAVSKYYGADIVHEMIRINNQKFASDKISFISLDLINDQIPEVDLILCRDCLVHFSYIDIKKSLQNMIKSKSKYLLTTSFTNRKSNYNIHTGDWRPINLEVLPFRLSNPILRINENCTEAGGKFSDKSLLLYNLQNVNTNTYNTGKLN